MSGVDTEGGPSGGCRGGMEIQRLVNFGACILLLRWKVGGQGVDVRVVPIDMIVLRRERERKESDGKKSYTYRYVSLVE